MPLAKSHSFAISGLSRAGRTGVYKGLESLLPDWFPDQTFGFLGNPFGTSKMCPFLLDEREKKQDTFTRLLKRWAKLNDFAVKELVPVLKEGHLAVSDGFGLDALLFTAGTLKEQADIEQATRIHHGLVKIRLKEQGIKPPHYFILKTTQERAMNKMRADPRLGHVQDVELRRFIRQQEKVINDYFLPNTGQTADFIDASFSVGEICRRIGHLMRAHMPRQDENVFRLPAQASG